MIGNYDLSKFHPDCGAKSIQSSFDGKLYVFCPKCQVLADIEAVSGKVTPAEVVKVGVERKIIGKQSRNVDRGGYVDRGEIA